MKAQRYKRTLQDLLAKALEDNDINAEKSIRNRMSRSYNLRALAVRKVLSNKGKRTAGIDKVL